MIIVSHSSNLEVNVTTDGAINFHKARFRPGFFIFLPFYEIIYLLNYSLYITSDALYQLLYPSEQINPLTICRSIRL